METFARGLQATFAPTLEQNLKICRCCHEARTDAQDGEICGVERGQRPTQPDDDHRDVVWQSERGKGLGFGHEQKKNKISTCASSAMFPCCVSLLCFSGRQKLPRDCRHWGAGPPPQRRGGGLICGFMQGGGRLEAGGELTRNLFFRSYGVICWLHPTLADIGMST